MASGWGVPIRAHRDLTLFNAHPLTSISKPLHDLSHGAPLLANGHVDAVKLLLCGGVKVQG